MQPNRPSMIATASLALALLGAVAAAAIDRAAEGKSPLRAAADPVLEVGPSLVTYEMASSAAAGVEFLQGFLNQHGVNWEVRWDERNDRPHLIQGEGIPLVPGRGNDLTAVQLGLEAGEEIRLHHVASLLESFIADHQELLRAPLHGLRLDTERSHPYGPGDAVWFVEFQQVHRGVPVIGANVFFRLNHGNIVQLGADRLSPVRLDTEPSVSRELAWRALLAHAGIAGREVSETLDRGTLEIHPVLTRGESVGERFAGAAGQGYSHRLGWSFRFRRAGDDATYGALVDAHSGVVLRLVDENRTADVTGGIYPVTNTDPEEVRGFPFCSVSNNGTKITDANGSYNYTGGTATATLNGRYIRISDNCGSISLSNSTTGNLSFGTSGGTNCTTPGVGGAGNTHAARSGFYHLTNINRKAASFFPSNSWLDGTLTANMNINNTCNAFWNGSTVNFYRAGGGCANTGELAAVFLHEWGHGMDTNTGGAANENGSGEAVGDTFAFLETRDACIGDNFLSTACPNCDPDCSGVRDVDAFALGGSSTIARPNTITSNSGINCDRFTCPYLQQGIFPYQGPMGYQGHCESYIASTANWDLTQMLIGEHGTEGGWSTMDGIWYGSLTPSKSAYRLASGGKCNPNASVDGCAATNWYTVYLPVDDDDGNLANGTPNGCLIWDAFDAHGIACGSRPQCSSTCTPVPIADAGGDQTICEGGSVLIGTPAQAGHSYSWSPGGQTAAQISVSPSATTTYTVTASTACGSDQDSVVVTVDSGSGGGLSQDFESGTSGWTTSGLWHLTNNSSCASPGYSSPTRAFYYGQDSTCTYNAGDNNGDLISPVIGGIDSSSTLSFDYYRVVESYSGGSYDRTEVAVSVAGSSTWTTVWSRNSTNASTAAWANSGSISLSAFAGNDIRLRFRFDTIDGSFNNFTGWFIDDVEVTGGSSCGGGGGGCAAEVDFESGAAGWTNSGASTCSTGAFVVAAPTQVSNGGVVTQVGGDHSNPGTNAFFTATNSSAGVDDVDGGNCIGLSPVYPVAEASDVSIWYFHGQRDAGGDPSGDFFRLEISTNGGSTWSTLESRGDVTSNAAWTEATTSVAAGTNVMFRVQASDGTASGDLVEAGVDDVSICPSN